MRSDEKRLQLPHAVTLCIEVDDEVERFRTKGSVWERYHPDKIQIRLGSSEENSRLGSACATLWRIGCGE